MNKPMKCLQGPLTDNALCDSLCSKSYKRGGKNAGILHEVQKKVEIKNPKAIAMKNKRPATQGVCPSCGTKVFRIGKS
jgi:hypothetical protein